MRCCDVVNEMFGSNEPSYTPASDVETLPSRANGQCQSCEIWRKRCNSSEWYIVQSIVDFIGEDDDVVFHTEVSNGGKLFD